MKIFGFDLSSRKIALVTLGEEDIDSDAHVFKVSKLKSRRDELWDLQTQLELEFENYRHPETWAYIEEPVVGRGGARPTILQAQVDGIIQAATVRFGLDGGYSVNNKTWKKAVVGHGNASKDDLTSWLATHHPVLADLAGDDQDLVDAACVAIYGRTTVTRGRTLVE